MSSLHFLKPGTTHKYNTQANRNVHREITDAHGQVHTHTHTNTYETDYLQGSNCKL